MAKNRVWIRTSNGSILSTETPQYWQGSERLTEEQARPLVMHEAVRHLGDVLGSRVYWVPVTASRVRLYTDTKDGLVNITADVAKICGLRFDGGNWAHMRRNCIAEWVDQAVKRVTIRRIPLEQL